MWVRFIADFNWKPRPQVTIAYKANSVQNVTTPCAEAAVAKGKAVKVPRARKIDADQGASPRS